MVNLAVQYRAIRNRHLLEVIFYPLITVLEGYVAVTSDHEQVRFWSFFTAVLTSVFFGNGFSGFLQARKNLQGLPTKTKFQSVEDRLDELERLKRRDMVTPEEYAAKRQEILNDL